MPNPPSNIWISTDAAGQPGDNASTGGSLSRDAAQVAFLSYASDLVPGDTNALPDVFVKNQATGAIIMASTNQAGIEANGSAGAPTLSSNGQEVAFDDTATNLVNADTGTGEISNVYVKNLATGGVTWVSAPTSGAVPNGSSFNGLISGNGGEVAFTSYASNLVPTATAGVTEVYAKDLRTGQLVLASTNAAGQAANAFSTGSAISADGRTVIFTSFATNLVAGVTGNQEEVFAKNLQTGQVKLVSADAAGDAAQGNSLGGAVSANGRMVVFESTATNLVPNDTTPTTNIFVKNLQTGAISLVSTGMDGQPANGAAVFPQISPDGRYVAFSSTATNLAAGNAGGTEDVFVKDLWTGQLALASVSFLGGAANGASYVASVADNGVVAYDSRATNLVPNDTNPSNVFLGNLAGLNDPPSDPMPGLLSGMASALTSEFSALAANVGLGGAGGSLPSGIPTLALGQLGAHALGALFGTNNG